MKDFKNRIESGGVIHLHTENSRKDSVASVKDMFAKAKELGASAVTLTDHGVLTGVEEAREIAEKIDIKFIPGVEGYYESSDEEIKVRKHLLLLAKDEIGYKAISLAVTASNENLDSQGFPIMTSDILDECFGKGSIGHGHVIATTACMQGVLSAVLLMNEKIHKEIAKVEEKQFSLNNPNNKVFRDKQARISAINDELADVAVQISSLQKLASKPFVKKEKSLKTLSGMEYEVALEELNAEKEESVAAGKRVEELKKQRTNLKLEQKALSDEIKPFINDEIKFNAYAERIETLKKDILSDEELYVKAKAEAEHFKSIFGEEDLYCEVQYHGIPQEAHVMPIVVKIARELGLHLVAANDSHMVDGSEDSVKARQLIRSLRFNKWEELFTGDTELYIKTDAELSEWLNKILDDNAVEEAMEGITQIVNKCNVVFKDEPHYPKFENENKSETSEQRLRRLAYEGIEWRFPNREGWTEKHNERLEEELATIEKLGFCDYLCIVEDFLSYGRLLGKIDMNDPRFIADPYNIDLLKELAKDKVGLGIGPGRGSAVGSLICYLIGITGIDPMQYALFFERFLNVERVTMPDIDSDFKTDIRDKVLDYVKYKYGPDAVCCIMTKGTQAAKASVRNAARIYGSEKANDTKAFLSLGDRIAKLIPADIGMTIAKCEDKLTEEFGADKDAMEIIKNAKLMEGSFINIGMHAAGVIISDNGDVKQYVPLMYNKDENQWMTQCEMGYCEGRGLLKMDFLGLRNLNIITETLNRIKDGQGKSIDIEKVPFEPDVFKHIFSKGNTNSVFQFESGGMKKMLMQFQPETIDDIILLVAAYRPGPMQFLDDIIAIKHGRKKPTYIIPEMEEILGSTYGSPIYQEQIMQIFNKFAGFTLGQSDIIRRLMSKKKAKEFMKYEQKFIEGLCASGADKTEAKKFWDQLVNFSSYAFNKSHATAYAFIAYYTAYLKYYYPKEYLCSVLNNTVTDKFDGLISDCRGFGVKLYPADINHSFEKFSLKNDGIVVGLGLVKSVGASAAPIIEERTKNGKFTSVADFFLRTRCAKDVVENLIYAGAFDEFTKNRQALVDAVPEYGDIIKKIKLKEAILTDVKELTNEKEIEKDKARKERAQTTLNTLVQNLNEVAVNFNGEEDFLQRLDNEKDKIGAFISGHPLDTYGTPSDFKCIEIDKLVASRRPVSIMGIINNLRYVNKKADGSKMAFFKLEDQTGMVDVCCFSETFKNFGNCVKADAVVRIVGECKEDTDNITDQTVLKFIAREVSVVEIQKETVAIKISSPIVWNEIKTSLNPILQRNGLNLVVFDEMNGVYRKTGLTVSNHIFERKELSPRKVKI